MALDGEKNDLNWPGPDNLFGYTGLGYDYTSGLSYARARYFDSGVGRFVSEDTYEGELTNPLSLNLYTYVSNNPLKYVDPSGHIPTPLEAANMARDIYSATIANSKNVILGGGWKLIDVITNKEGLKIGIYSRNASNGLLEYALVNKGTTTGGDWINNLQQPMGMSTDMVDSIKYAVSFVNNKTGYEVTMIGHSKGGAEATANALATNTNAITFNSATPNVPVYDLLYEVDNKKKWHEYTATMVHYAVKGDVLTGTMGTPPYGNTVYLPNQHPTKWWHSGARIIKNGINNHSMESVIKALIEQEGYN